MEAVASVNLAVPTFPVHKPESGIVTSLCPIS